MADAVENSLADILSRHEITLSEPQIQRLDRYCQLLWEWNENLNLTRHTDYEKFVARDVVDSLTLAQFLPEKSRVLDVGTGGGVPGVILAIAREDLKVELCDSVAKKARAVADIVERIPLAAKVHHARAEEVLATHRFETLVVRAVAPLTKLLTWLKPHWDRFDRLLLIKGPAWVEERGEARHHGLMNTLRLSKLAEYPLPGTDSSSVVLELKKK